MKKLKTLIKITKLINNNNNIENIVTIKIKIMIIMMMMKIRLFPNDVNKNEYIYIMFTNVSLH
jgi:hypothetical protein